MRPADVALCGGSGINGGFGGGLNGSYTFHTAPPTTMMQGLAMMQQGLRQILVQNMIPSNPPQLYNDYQAVSELKEPTGEEAKYRRQSRSPVRRQSGNDTQHLVQRWDHVVGEPYKRCE